MDNLKVKVIFNSVSILVLMDLSFLQTGIICIIYSTSKFQSLFLWIFRSYENIVIKKTTGQEGFNPCSYGSFVLTADAAFEEYKTLTFQSLFLWIFRSYNMKMQFIADFLGLFQSLFLWIFRSYTN